MTDRELMQQALNVLKIFVDGGNSAWARKIIEIKEALRDRLAQPEEPDWSAAGFSKPPTHSEAWWKHEASNAYANGYEKGRASVKQPEQEPVAWADKYDIERDGHDFWVSRQQPAKNGVPLYTAPPQREWQGLTDEEMMMIYGQNHEGKKYSLGRAIEAKLKEKNHG